MSPIPRRGKRARGRIAVTAIEKNDLSEIFLSKYEKKIMKDFGKRHHRLYKIKNVMHQLSDDDLNYIAQKVSSISREKRTLTDIFKYAVYKKPSLIIDVIKSFAGT